MSSWKILAPTAQLVFRKLWSPTDGSHNTVWKPAGISPIFVSWSVWMQERKLVMQNWGQSDPRLDIRKISLTYLCHWSFPQSHWRLNKPFVQLNLSFWTKVGHKIHTFSWAKQGETTIFVTLEVFFSGWTSAELSSLTKQFGRGDEFKTCH